MELILPSIMELRRPGRLAIGDLLRGLQRTLVLELGGHANRAESAIADPSLDAGVGRASHHPTFRMTVAFLTARFSGEDYPAGSGRGGWAP